MCYIIILVFSSSDTGDRMEDNNKMVEHRNQLKLNSSLTLPVKPTRVSIIGTPVGETLIKNMR